MKNQRGITLVSLIITIVVMAILAGTTVFVSMDRFKTNNLRKMYNDITLLNDKIENYYLKYGGLPALRDDSNNIINYNHSQLDFNKNVSDNSNYYIIDLSAIGNITLNYGQEGYEHPNTSDDVYILNEKTHTVYYVKGIENKDGKLYHSLSFDDSGSIQSVGVTKPEIIFHKMENCYEVEIIPGKDSISGVQKTEYKITSTDFDKNVTEGETIEISERTVVGNLDLNKAHEVQVTTTSNNQIHTASTQTAVLNKWIRDLNIGDYVNYSAHIPDVTLTNDSQLIQDLTTYSGNTDSNYNTKDTISQEKTLGWRVLDIKDGKLRLISATQTSSQISLKGSNGYNNAVYLLDEVCDTLYSSNKGKTQNLKIEDIEAKIDRAKFDYTEYINTNATPNIRYGETREITSYLLYPNIYSKEEGCKAISSEDNTGNTLDVSEQSELILGNNTASTRLKITQTYWFKDGRSNLYRNDIYKDIFHGNGNIADYWISSRSINCMTPGSDDIVSYSIRVVNSPYSITDCSMLNSYSIGSSSVGTRYLRPVVTLNSDVKIGEKVNNVWQIQ